MAKGGAQPGAGRKVGSKSKISLNKLAEILEDKDMLKMTKKGVQMAIAGDKELIKYYSDQYYGKAVNTVEGNMAMTFEQLIAEHTKPDE